MNRLLSVLILAGMIVSGAAYSQSCDGYFPSKKGSVIETTMYNDKGKKQGTNTLTIQDINSSGSEVRYKLHSEMKDEKDKPMSQSDYDAYCANNSFYINMKSLISSEQMAAWKDMEVDMKADDIEFPTTLTEGQKLPDAHLSVNMKMSGVSMPEFKIDVTERTVVGKESITTPAGTFECWKITSKQKIKNIMSYDMNAIEWVSKGNGVIKTQSFKGEKLKGYSEVTSIK